MNLKCEVCGKIAVLDEKDAFKEGWDFPPLSPVTTCGSCPSAPLAIQRCCERDTDGDGNCDRHPA